MQVTFDLVDFSQLADRTAEEILFELFEDDDFADTVFVKSGYDFGVSDSSRLYGSVQDVSESVDTGLNFLFLPDGMYDDLHLRSYPDEGYVSSASPRHLQAAVEHATRFRSLDVVRDVPEARDYLERCLEMVTYGVQHGLGLLIHMG